MEELTCCTTCSSQPDIHVAAVITGLTKQILAEREVEPQSVIRHQGESLLYLAAKQGNVGLAILLLTGDRLGNDRNLTPPKIDARNTLGQPALFEAAFHGLLTIASFFFNFTACMYRHMTAGFQRIIRFARPVVIGC